MSTKIIITEDLKRHIVDTLDSYIKFCIDSSTEIWRHKDELKRLLNGCIKSYLPYPRVIQRYKIGVGYENTIIWEDRFSKSCFDRFSRTYQPSA
jgi:hypothetical protein